MKKTITKFTPALSLIVPMLLVCADKSYNRQALKDDQKVTSFLPCWSNLQQYCKTIDPPMLRMSRYADRDCEPDTAKVDSPKPGDA